MPTVNIFSANDTKLSQVDNLHNELKAFLAQELSGENIQLAPTEISIRLIKDSGHGMLAALEVEVTANAFDERVKKQDEICIHIKQFLEQRITATEIRVWLSLSQLGHSWE
jgi:uncharacterized OsmC-like protein